MTEVGAVVAGSAASPDRRVPGEEGVWVFVLGDMCVFALFFGTFMYSRSRNPAAFARDHLHLHAGLGALNTVLLLSSSLLVALAVQRVVSGRAAATTRLLTAALCCGAGFTVVKTVEWVLLLRSGIGLGSGEYFSYYFMFTGIHLAHVLIGMTLVARIALLSRTALVDARLVRTCESGGVFWHMVDLLWVVLFALFYLAG